MAPSGGAAVSYDLRTCYHEAGHAVVAMLHGVDVVEVVASRRSGGVVRFTGPIADPLTHLHVCQAGWTAEHLAVGNHDANTSQEDRAFADQAAFECAAGDLQLADELRTAVRYKVLDDLVDHWATVETIVEALLRSPLGRLTAAELPPIDRKRVRS